MPAGFRVGLCSLHQIVLKLRDVAVEQQALVIQGAVKVSLIASLCHPQLDFQVAHLPAAHKEGDDEDKEEQVGQDRPFLSRLSCVKSPEGSAVTALICVK